MNPPTYSRHSIHHISGVSFSPDGRRLVSASRNRTVRVSDTLTGEVVVELTPNSDWVNGPVFSPDEAFIAAGGGGRLHVLLVPGQHERACAGVLKPATHRRPDTSRSRYGHTTEDGEDGVEVPAISVAEAVAEVIADGDGHIDLLKTGWG